MPTGLLVRPRTRPRRTASISSPHRSGRVIELDGLRGIATIAVLLSHFWRYPAGYEAINRFVRTGWVAIDLYFVLSGFLITGILWDARHSLHYYRDFYVRRVLRIFPLYYALLFVAFVLLPLHGVGPASRAVLDDRFLYLTYLANVAIVLHGWQLFALDITWSLALEEQFYLAWPFVIRRMPIPALVGGLASIVIVAPMLRTVAWLRFNTGWMATHMLTVFRLDSLALGGLLALVVREGWLRPDLLRRLASGILAVVGPILVLLVATDHFRRDSMLVGTIGYSLLAVFFAALLVCSVFPGRRLSQVLSHAGLCRLGVVSYGVYLAHPLCLMVVGTALATVGLELDNLTRWPLVSSIGAVLLPSACAYGVAELSYRYFERPILALKQPLRRGDAPLAL